MTRSSKLFILASAFSLTYGATISRSDVYYFIMKRPLTESSRIFMTYSDMNYFYCLVKDLHRLRPSCLCVFFVKLYNFFIIWNFLWFKSFFIWFIDKFLNSFIFLWIRKEKNMKSILRTDEVHCWGEGIFLTVNGSILNYFLRS